MLRCDLRCDFKCLKRRLLHLTDAGQPAELTCTRRAVRSRINRPTVPCLASKLGGNVRIAWLLAATCCALACSSPPSAAGSDGDRQPDASASVPVVLSEQI